MPMPRVPNDCRDCAYAGEPPDESETGDVVYCFRRRTVVPATGRCNSGVPLKVASGRLKKREDSGLA